MYKQAALRKGFGDGPIPVNTLHIQPQELFAEDIKAQTVSGSNVLTVGVNHDTLLTVGWLDFRQGPFVLHVPAMSDRYYSVQFTDPSKNINFACVGTRTTGTQAGDYLITGRRLAALAAQPGQKSEPIIDSLAMKNDFSRIHPELQKIAKIAPKITYRKRNLWFYNFLTRLIPAAQPLEDVLIENVLIPRQEDRAKIRLRIYKPKSVDTPTAALLWMHGGGYVMGKPEQDDVSCTQYVRALGITVVSVDYRYAPRYPFPTGLEDGYSALKWVVSHSQQMGIDASLIAIGGASAGGGLTASLVQLAHDRQEIEPVFQLLVYPMLDDRTVLRADIDDSNNVTWNHKSNQFGWESYLGKKCGAEDVPEYSVPSRRKDLSGLPPAWIGVGTLDIFYDEDLAYARRLNESGIPCEVYPVPGAFHGFDVFDADLPIVQKFRESQISALKKYLCRRI